MYLNLLQLQYSMCIWQNEKLINGGHKEAILIVNFQTAEIAKIKAQSAEKCILNNLLSEWIGLLMGLKGLVQ